MIRRVLARLAVLAAAALVLALLALFALVPAPGEPRTRSVFSAEPDGLRALYLTVQALGLPVSAWTGAPGELAGRRTLLVLAGLPRSPLAPPEREAAPSSAPRHARDPAHYRRFLEDGGTLLLLGADAERLEFLCAAGLPGCGEVAFSAREPERSPLVFAGGASLTLDPGPAGALAAQGADVFLRAEQDAVGVSLPAGAGRLALLALAPDAFSNARLRASAGPALLFVRTLEALGPVERVLFDEYALGGWDPPSVLELALRPRLAWLSAHLLLLAVLLGWRSAWSGPFPRDPEPRLAASPLARAQGFARTLARAGRWDLLARLLRRGALERWCLRAGLRAPAVDAAGLSEPAALERSLSALARGDERLLQRLLTAAGERAATSEADFEALAGELSALETRLFPPEGGKMPARRGPDPARAPS